ncbi:MAG: MFS transporter [Pseudomonadota bacterium]
MADQISAPVVEGPLTAQTTPVEPGVTHELPFTRRAAWASGSLGTAAFTNAFALFGLFFMTNMLGIAAGVAGALIFVSKLYDAFSDPIMGGISDGFKKLNRERRLFLLPGAVLSGLMFAAFFFLPTLEGGWGVALTFLTLIGMSTAFTIYAVPYLAMPPEIEPTYQGRTKLMSYRVFFIMIGVLLGSAGAPFLVSLMDEPRNGYRLAAAVVATLIVLSGLSAYFGTRGLEKTSRSAGAEDVQPSVFASLLDDPFGKIAGIFSNAPFRILTLVKLLQLAVLAIILAATPYFFRYVLELGNATIGIYFSVFGMMGILMIPVLRFAIAKFGKKTAYIRFLALYALGVASWIVWTPAEPEIFLYLRAAFIGTVSTGALFCVLALLPDTMEYDRLASGEAREGAMSGIFTLVEKVSGAIGPLIVGVMLQSMGLIASYAPDVVQPASAILAIKLCASLVPAGLTLLCIPLMLTYKLDEDALNEARLAANQGS